MDKIKEVIKKNLKDYIGGENYLKIKRFYFMLINIVNVKKNICGIGNVIRFKNAFLKNIVFEISGNNNKIEIEDDTIILRTKIVVVGNNHLLKIGKDCYFQGVEIRFEDSGCSIIIDDGVVIVDKVRISAVEPGRKVIIGKRTKIGEGTDIRTTDAHSIIDLESGKRINPGADIVIGERVWMPKDINILKGVTIGNDAIIGIRSLVTKDVPANCLAVGVPARVVKRNICWRWDRI